ncbi:MAG: oligosaccharide flippase family protein, partial [Terriglobia bacterium]
MMANSSFAIGANIESFWKRVRSSTAASQHVKNVAFSLSEYVAIPLLYLAATPLLVQRLGLDLYGLWMLINSIVAITGTVNFGFGDSTLRFVSMYRGRGETASIVRGVRTAYSVSLLIALVAGSLMFLCAPLLVSVLKIPAEITMIATQGLQLGAVLLALQVIESVFVGAFRGHERYDLSVLISLGTRGAILLAAVVVVLNGLGLKEILVASVGISLIGLVIQGEIVRRLTQSTPWKPQIDKAELQAMFGFGMYAWLISAAWLVFSHADRLVIGALLGTSALAVYTVCLQLAQQIHGVVGAGFSVVFPAISRRMGTAT